MSEMELITIDSSEDDDDDVKGAVNTLDQSRDVVSHETIDIQSSSDSSDDNSSVSSSDSIWDKRGLTSSSIKSSKECGAAAVSQDSCLMRNFEDDERNVEDEINTSEESQQMRHEASSICKTMGQSMAIILSRPSVYTFAKPRTKNALEPISSALDSILITLEVNST